MKEDNNSNRIIKESLADDSWMDEILEGNSKSHYLSHSNAIATEILLELKRRKMSQTELANRLHVSPQYINKIVKGSENLTLDTIGKIERELEIQLIVVPGSEKKDATMKKELSQSSFIKNLPVYGELIPLYQKTTEMVFHGSVQLSTLKKEDPYSEDYYEQLKQKAIQNAHARFDRLHELKSDEDFHWSSGFFQEHIKEVKRKDKESQDSLSIVYG